MFKNNDVVSKRAVKTYIMWFANTLIIYAESAKATHIFFSAKNVTGVFDFNFAKTVNEVTLNKLNKLVQCFLDPVLEYQLTLT